MKNFLVTLLVPVLADAGAAWIKRNEILLLVIKCRSANEFVLVLVIGTRGTTAEKVSNRKTFVFSGA
jgi:hypothetical protein